MARRIPSNDRDCATFATLRMRGSGLSGDAAIRCPLARMLPAQRARLDAALQVGPDLDGGGPAGGGDVGRGKRLRLAGDGFPHLMTQDPIAPGGGLPWRCGIRNCISNSY